MSGVFGPAPGADHLRALRDEQGDDFDGLLQDAAAVRAVVEDEAPQLAFALQRFERGTQFVVTPLGEVAVLDVADAVGHIAVVGHRRDGDALAAQGELLLLAAEQPFDGQLDLGAGAPLEQGAHLLDGHAPGLLPVDAHDAVADADAGAVGGRAFVGLCEDDVVALLADERADAAVLAGGQQLEVRHLLLGHELGVGVERAGHARRGLLHQPVGGNLVHIVEAQFPHQVDEDFRVAPQPEIVAPGESQRAQRKERGGKAGRAAE